MKSRKVVTDSGPIIHLAEIHAEKSWEIFQRIMVPPIVVKEVQRGALPGSKVLEDDRFVTIQWNKSIDILGRKFLKRYKMSNNDSHVLACSVSKGAYYLLTDDLKLREFAIKEGIVPVGSVGILLRSFRNGIYNRNHLFDFLDLLLNDSSLYITVNLIEEVKRDVIEYERKKKC